MRNLLAAACIAFLVLSASSIAAASHYPLESVVWIDAEELSQLQEDGLQDTEQLLQAVLDPDRRQTFTQRTGIPAERALELALRADLLQISGVGPDTVEGMRQAEIRGSAHLLTFDEDALQQKLTEAYAELGRPGDAIPPLDTLKTWLEAARDLPFALVL